MAQHLRNLGVMALLLASAAPTNAAVLNFDDLGGLDFFTADYMGFQFGDNSPATNPWFHTQQVSPFYVPKSPKTYISTDFSLYDNTNTYEATQAISNTTAFKFDGAYFTGDSAIGYQLKLAGLTVFTSAAPSAALNNTPTFVASGYVGLVNEVIVFGHQGFYALDDFTYNSPVVAAPAPESATWAMMIAGFGMIGATLRVRGKSSVRFA